MSDIDHCARGCLSTHCRSSPTAIRPKNRLQSRGVLLRLIGDQNAARLFPSLPSLPPLTQEVNSSFLRAWTTPSESHMSVIEPLSSASVRNASSMRLRKLSLDGSCGHGIGFDLELQHLLRHGEATVQVILPYPVAERQIRKAPRVRLPHPGGQALYPVRSGAGREILEAIEVERLRALCRLGYCLTERGRIASAFCYRAIKIFSDVCCFIMLFVMLCV